jgi:CobQ-like glutamine amidotransferase family enzyme
MSTTKLQICHLYPDLLNLYGDRGNILCFRRRLEWRGLECEVTEVGAGDTADFTQFDLIFIGGGQDFEQEVLLRDLAGEKTREICAAIEDEKPFLAICGGYQMLGQYYRTWDGIQCDFTGALDLYTIGSKDRMIGNYAFSCDAIGGETVVGFENHSGKTYLGSGVLPLGKVLAGFGNNGDDGTEGVHYKNVFGTYSHGCLLPKNPKLCDHILLTALKRKYGACELQPLDDVLENNAHDYMVARLLK